MTNNEEKNETLTPTEPKTTPQEKENNAKSNSETLSSKYKRCVRCGALILQDGDRCRNCGCSQLLPMKKIVRMHTPPFENKLNQGPRILLATLSIILLFLLIFSISARSDLKELESKYEPLATEIGELKRALESQNIVLQEMQDIMKESGLTTEPEAPKEDTPTDSDTEQEMTDTTDTDSNSATSETDTTDNVTDEEVSDTSETDTTDNVTDEEVSDTSETDANDNVTDEEVSDTSAETTESEISDSETTVDSE